jgi:putative aldouronate transport system substrate-binding protein
MLKGKKSLIMLIAVSMILSSVITGCKTTPKSVSTTAGVPKDPYEINWYVLGNGQPKDTASIEAEVNKYIKPKINATLKLTCFDWGSYEQKLKAMIASGEYFDICFTATWPNDYVGNASNGAFVALNDPKTNLLNKYAPKTKALLGDDFLNASQIKGINYGIPANKEKARNIGIVYNKTLAQKYNFDMTTVKKLEDIEPMLQKIKDNEKGVTPYENYGSATQYIPWTITGNGDVVGILGPDGTYINQYATTEYKTAYDLARKWYKAGYYKTDAATATNKEAEVTAGKFFAYTVNLKPGYTEELSAADKKNGFERGQVDITTPTMTNNETMGSLQAISVTSKNPVRSMMFLELVNTDKYLNNLLNFGIEGKNYTKIDANTISPIADSGYNMNMQWMFGNQMLNYLQSNENPKKWELFAAYNKSAVIAPDLGFIFDNSNVKTEQAACNNAVKEFVPVLKCGAVDPGPAIQKLNDKLKASGIDTYLKELNKQFVAFKASKK